VTPTSSDGDGDGDAVHSAPWADKLVETTTPTRDDVRLRAALLDIQAMLQREEGDVSKVLRLVKARYDDLNDRIVPDMKQWMDTAPAMFARPFAVLERVACGGLLLTYTEACIAASGQPHGRDPRVPVRVPRAVQEGVAFDVNKRNLSGS